MIKIFKKVLSLGLIVLMLFSCLGNLSASDPINLTILNKDTLNNNIASIGHAKIRIDKNLQYFDIKKGEVLNTKFNPQTVYNRYGYMCGYRLIDFDTKTGHPADFDLGNSNFDWGNLPKYIGNLSITLEVRQFKGRTQYNNKIDYVKVTSDKLGEVIKVGSPSNFDRQHVTLSIVNRGDKFCFNVEGHTRYMDSDEKNIDGVLFEYKYGNYT